MMLELGFKFSFRGVILNIKQFKTSWFVIARVMVFIFSSTDSVNAQVSSVRFEKLDDSSSILGEDVILHTDMHAAYQTY